MLVDKNKVEKSLLKLPFNSTPSHILHDRAMKDKPQSPMLLCCLTLTYIYSSSNTNESSVEHMGFHGLFNGIFFIEKPFPASPRSRVPKKISKIKTF